MSKICKDCRSVKSGFVVGKSDNFILIYYCNSIKYKRSRQEHAILNGNKNALNLTDADLKKYPISTDYITDECPFFKAKK